jgi:hypothetical protein
MTPSRVGESPWLTTTSYRGIGPVRSHMVARKS